MLRKISKVNNTHVGVLRPKSEIKEYEEKARKTQKKTRGKKTTRAQKAA
jgi:hypothetical protein